MVVYRLKLWLLYKNSLIVGRHPTFVSIPSIELKETLSPGASRQGIGSVSDHPLVHVPLSNEQDYQTRMTYCEVPEPPL